MSFTETRLNLGIPPSTGGPQFSTSVIRVGSGFEKRRPARSGYLFKGDIGKLILTEKEIAYVTAFFNARKGRAIAFRWKYWADYECTHETLEIDPFTTTQGVIEPVSGTSQYQLKKRYTSFGVDSYKPIYKPVEPIEVYVNGTLQTSGVTIDYTRGLVTFSSPPASGDALRWSGEFDLPVRFDSDKLPGVTQFIDPSSKELLFRFDSLPILETIEMRPITYSYVPRNPCVGTSAGVTTGSGAGSGGTGGGGTGGGGGTANQRHRCQNGACIPDPSGPYANLAECEAALIPAPFNGGQCQCVLYSVYAAGYTQGSAPPAYSGVPPSGAASSPSCRVYGPILDTRTVTGLGPSGYFFNHQIYCRGMLSPGGFDPVCTESPVWRSFAGGSGGSSENLDARYAITAIVREDGNPDNCGNPPPKCP